MFTLDIQSALFNFSFTVILLLIARLIYQMVLKPFWLIRFYKNQGAESIFFPGIGFGKANYDSFTKHGDCHYYEKEMAKSKPDTKTWVTNLGKNVILHILDPNLLKEFYKLQSVEPTLYSRDLDFWWVFLETTGQSASFLEGSAWKKHRKATSSFLSTKYIEKISPIVIEKISAKLKAKVQKEDLKTFETVCELTGEVIGYIMFGDDYSKINFNGRPFKEFMAELTLRLMKIFTSPANALLGSWFIKLGLTAEHKKLFEMTKVFKTTCRRLVSNKISEMRVCRTESEDLLSHLARQNIENPSEALSVEEIIGMISGMIVSGVDTTAQMAGMALYYLNLNPEVKQKLKSEFSQESFEMKYENLMNLDYLEAIIKETLRHSSFANKLIFRIAQRDHMIGDLKIKKGTYLTTSFLFNNYCTKYHDSPNSFYPERWIDKSSRTRIQYEKDPMMFIPFSEGSRICMGRNLATFEAKVIIGIFMKYFDFELEQLKDNRWDVKFFYGPIVDPKIMIYNVGSLNELDKRGSFEQK